MFYFVFRMYPYALISAEFPASKPKTLVAPTVQKLIGPHNQLLYRGIISALVLPSLNVPYVGLLPVRLRRRLSKATEVFYPLCAQCARNGVHGCFRMHPCAHSETKRALRGCWTSLELQFALNHGYQILEVYQVGAVFSLYYRDCVCIKNVCTNWNYSQQVLYFDVFRNDLFKPYISYFARQKIISSPFPRQCSRNDQERTAYLEACSKQLGVSITVEDMKLCPTTRAISKLFLNTL